MGRLPNEPILAVALVVLALSPCAIRDEFLVVVRRPAPSECSRSSDPTKRPRSSRRRFRLPVRMSERSRFAMGSVLLDRDRCSFGLTGVTENHQAQADRLRAACSTAGARTVGGPVAALRTKRPPPLTGVGLRSLSGGVVSISSGGGRGQEREQALDHSGLTLDRGRLLPGRRNQLVGPFEAAPLVAPDIPLVGPRVVQLAFAMRRSSAIRLSTGWSQRDVGEARASIASGVQLPAQG
jgi:hypothetical protein